MTAKMPPKHLPGRKLKVRGVVHATLTRRIFGKPIPTLKNLYAELKRLKQERISKIGVEFIQSKPLQGEQRSDRTLRYFRGMALLLQRLGMQGIIIDDPHAFRLQEVISSIRAQQHLRFLHIGPREAEAQKEIQARTNLRKIQSYFPAKPIVLEGFYSAVLYFRSLLMEKNAHSLGLKAIVVGGGHATHLEERGQEVIQLDDSLVQIPSNPLEKIAFGKYKKGIVRILRDMKSGKLSFD